MINIIRFTGPITFFALTVVWSTSVHAQITNIDVGYSASDGDALPAWDRERCLYVM